jgi:hypothetical protein
MSRTILIIGDSGSGKSTSLRNLDPATTFIVKPNTKPLPFKGAKAMYSAENKNVARINSFPVLTNFLGKINKDQEHIKTVIIEDISHFFTSKVMADSKKKGFDKWDELGVQTYNAFLAGEQDMLFRDDLTIVLIGHVDVSEDSNGVSRNTLYTPGKILERKVKIPSYVTYQFYADVDMQEGKPHYYFLTNNDGSGRECKTPMDMFEDLKVDNDLAQILETIDNYE